MKKRLASLLLACVLVVSVLTVGAVPVSAESTLKTSQQCIDTLKAEEGFSRFPYWDYAQYTVGYGTRCPDDMLDYYTENGITEAEAEALLYNYLNQFEEELHNKLISKYQLTLSQHQFDALVMFSYNCGTAWLYKETDNLRNAIVSGATGNELIDRFARWCNAGGQILTALLRRRLCEANMYLNGIYSQKAPDNFAYVLYDATGGVSDPNVQGYNTDLTAAIIPTPTYEGYTFQGWYTERLGGTKVTILDASVRNARLYAHWLDTEGRDPAEEEDAEGTKVTVQVDGLNVRGGPGTNYDAVGGLNKGDQVVITETAVNGDYVWGKFYAGWIRLDYTDYDAPVQDAPKPVQPSGKVMGTVKVNDLLRVRSGPSTAYDVVDHLKNGDRVEVLEQTIEGHMVWGKISKGWISLDYVVLDEPEETEPEQTPPEESKPEETLPDETLPEETKPEETQPEQTPPEETQPEQTPPEQTQPETTVLKGTVKVNEFLRVRKGPGTSYDIAGYLKPNERVEVLETQKVGSVTWGKITMGWVSMDYIVLDKTESTDNNNQSGATTQAVMGTIKVNDFLRIRTGPSTSYAIAGYLSPNERVEILEQKTVGATTWGRISKGWISMDYVELDKAAAQQPENTTPSQPNTPSQPETSTPEQNQPVTKTVIADCLRIRSGAGTNHEIVGYLYTGAKVEILETKDVNGTAWGRISNGWISMDYVV